MTALPALSAPVRPFPLVPSAFWDTNPTVEWHEVHPASKFGMAAAKLGLRSERCRNGLYKIWTTQEELALLILKARERGGD